MLNAEINGIAHYLIQDGLLTPAKAHQAMLAAKQQGSPFARYLVQMDLVDSNALLNCCAQHFNLPTYDLTQIDPAIFQQSIIKYELMVRYRIIPLAHKQDTLQLGLSDPTDHAAITAVRFHTGMRIQPVLVNEAELEFVIQKYCQPNMLYAQLETTLSKMTPVEEPTSYQDQTEQNDEPVIEFVNHLIQDAIQKNVSDIHIESQKAHHRIRFRRDGLLYEAATIPAHLAMRVITRLKIMAQINIAERRLPQDGRLKLASNKTIDIRVNTCPTIYGEKIVLRLLNNQAIHFNIEALGLSEKQKQLFLQTLQQPQGLILVTGPTGSGKTITLYAALQHLNQIEKNISSVEDPVEIELPGINQINIHPRIGLDFPTVLRTFLRQDPDIMMVGEIRDLETATIAMQAAQTGHLVLSTLHTNHAAETINRLQAMGLAAYHIISSLSLIVAQRLVRILCNHCKQPEILSANIIPISTEHTTYQAKGCKHCHDGYHGRIGVFECLPITKNMAQLILTGATTQAIIQHVKQAGWPTLWESSMAKVLDGTTSYAEITRVIGHPAYDK